MQDAEIYADIYPLVLKHGEEPFYQLGARQHVKLGEEMDVVLMRQDPPFDMNYLTYTYFLEHIESDCLIINRPQEVRNCPEKLFVNQFQAFMPKTLIARSKQAIIQFHAQYEDIVIKPLYAFGGRDVFRIQAGDPNFMGIVEVLDKMYQCPMVVQEFMPALYETGDKRIILIDGEPAGALTRIPAKGGVRSNLVAGGVAHQTSITEEDMQICNAVGPELKRRGLLLAGLDVIGGRLTEINVTSPTGFQAINQLSNLKLERNFWDVVETKIKQREAKGLE
jgi:glutathione synthase